MGIKRKQAGAVPIFLERWKELAKDPTRLSEAREQYMRDNPKAKLVPAHRVVKAFHDNFIRTYKSRKL